MAERAILHVDMDAFFASIAQLDDPSLRGRPVLTGGTSGRGVVTSASYEARPFGCRSAMPMAVAKRLCPQAVCVKVAGERIRELSHAVFEVLETFTPLVQPVSVDEAYLDVTGSVRLLGEPAAIAAAVKRAVREATGLTASVGLSTNKFLAKLASELDKPDGLTHLPPDRVDALLGPRPVADIFGIGPATARRLQRQGIETVRDLRALDADRAHRLLGDAGPALQRRCLGIDGRPVTPDRAAKSIGHEHTFAIDVADADALDAELVRQADHVAARLRRHGVTARTVTLKLRTPDFNTVTRAKTLPQPTDLSADLLDAARAVFAEWATPAPRPLRLLGITADHLTRGPAQEPLFDRPRREQLRRLDAAIDTIHDRFGDRSVTRAAALPTDAKTPRSDPPR
ncbi:MAG: DNA polymerase IV [Planctomycetota bacterium]